MFTKLTRILITTSLFISIKSFGFIEIQGINLVYPQSGEVQVILSSKYKFDYKSFKLSKNVSANKPDRFVIDALNSKPRFYLDDRFQGQFDQDPILQKIRVGKYHKGFTRIVMDLRQAALVKVEEQKNRSGGFQLTITFTSTNANPINRADSNNSSSLTPKINAEIDKIDLTDTGSTLLNTHKRKRTSGPFNIIIDAGHGGRDPGAVNKNNGVFEKNITYAISQKINRILQKDPKYNIILTRDSDILQPLGKRIDIAHENKGDVFISIHADSFPWGEEVRGASVYVLAKDKASSQLADLLATKENSVDKIYRLQGIAEVKDPEAQYIVRDLQVKSVTNASDRLAEVMIKQIGNVKNMFDTSVHKGRFKVLSSSYIPSVLIEVGFISNAEEAIQLTNQDEQQKIAKAISDGIKVYIEKYLYSSNSTRITQKKKLKNSPTPKPITKVTAKTTKELLKELVGDQPGTLITPDTLLENNINLGNTKKVENVTNEENEYLNQLIQAPVQPNAIKHEVFSGETWLSISKQYDVTEEALKKENAKYQEIIFPGDELIIPKK